jgi:hypothetical protein
VGQSFEPDNALRILGQELQSGNPREQIDPVEA